MKRILIALLMAAVVLSAAACTGNDTPDLPDDPGTSDNAHETPDDTSADTEAPAPAKNEGELKAGVYTATSSYATEGMNMTWNFVLTLKEDGTFHLANDAGEEKGAGTYALTEDCYTLSYSDERTSTFVVQQDGTLKMTSDFPYGIAQIQLQLVGDIVFTYKSEVPADTTAAEEDPADETTETYTIAEGTYAASYEKNSAMAGTVVYNYTATVGADGAFSYKVTFEMGGTPYDGESASGTYVLNGNTFTFTDSEGNVTEGTLTADNTLVISLKASAMAKEPYEVTFAPAAYTIAEGTYTAAYEKTSQMAGTVVYNYTATVGADGAFSYKVTFEMGGTPYDGESASGTYALNGNTFTFTDSEGNVTEGTLTADNTLVISLKASAMAKEPYEVTFVLAPEEA